MPRVAVGVEADGAGCLVQSRSSHRHFLQAGKLAVDRGWAINVGKDKCGALNGTGNSAFKIISFSFSVMCVLFIITEGDG